MGKKVLWLVISTALLLVVPNLVPQTSGWLFNSGYLLGGVCGMVMLKYII